TGKLDARLSKAIDITLTGSYTDSKNRFTPGGWRLMNSHNNPYDLDNIYRGNFRFRHRLGGAAAQATDGSDDARKASVIQNAEYTLQFGYERSLFTRENPVHQDNYFNYGYLGRFEKDLIPTFGPERV